MTLTAEIETQEDYSGTSRLASLEFEGEHYEDRVYLPRLIGDGNGDGTVGGRDLILLMQVLAHWDKPADEFALGVSAEGAVNGRDAVRLAQYLAGWGVKLGPEE